jgi:hypothetical protein
VTDQNNIANAQGIEGARSVRAAKRREWSDSGTPLNPLRIFGYVLKKMTDTLALPRSVLANGSEQPARTPAAYEACGCAAGLVVE